MNPSMHLQSSRIRSSIKQRYTKKGDNAPLAEALQYEKPGRVVTIINTTTSHITVQVDNDAQQIRRDTSIIKLLKQTIMPNFIESFLDI